ncbi:hypothetical protein MICAH_7060004 [Microcystis aeruginosa PCC 9809]|uniref:Uncharacterized protein n=1 Tax=Microcystis aeruginosa PCC 9809 TaxID=1160285 RepID=I4I6M6_MICAE|nr:hypothetical protein MICAH_7060004 [Microcystis aeruginosa PCC 9809]
MPRYKNFRLKIRGFRPDFFDNWGQLEFWLIVGDYPTAYFFDNFVDFVASSNSIIF